MGNQISRHKPDDVPWSVLQSEIASLNQDGELELQGEYGGGSDHDGDFESGVFDRFHRCKKKRDHDKFIAIKDFAKHHLPDSARCPYGEALVRQMALRTVRLIPTRTSTRPKPFKTLNCRRNGSGYVDLESSMRPVPGFRAGTTFFVCTAIHVVYDDDEAKSTDVMFLFDNDEDRSGVIMAKGVRIENPMNQGDRSILLCQVESREVGEEIYERIAKGDHNLLPPPGFQLTFAISHPHGTAQKVSFGELCSVMEASSKTGAGVPTLILSRIPTWFVIEEKKIFYFAMSEITLGFVFVKGGSFPKNVWLQHLVSKGLLTQPSEIEVIRLRAVWSTCQNDIRLLVDQEYTHRTGGKSLSASEEKVIMDEIKPQIHHKAVAGFVVPDGFEDRYSQVIQKLITVGHLFGKDERINTSYLKYVTYSVPTCVGSSGCMVFSYAVTDYGVKMYYVTHSRSTNSSGNKSGYGIQNFTKVYL